MKSAKECCMCGDIGFSRELFRCRKCLHRSQHTYCSVLYPNTRSYEVCDWCLRTSEEPKTCSCNIAVGAAGNEKKQELGASIRIIKHKSVDKAAGLAHCSTQNAAERANPRGNCTEGREFALEEMPNAQKRSNIQQGQGRKLDSKVVFRMNTKSPMRDAEASTPRPLRGKVRRYKLLEEVSS